MKLSLRVNYILFPVIVAIFAMAGLFTYAKQKQMLIDADADKMSYTSSYILQNISNKISELHNLTEVILNSNELIKYSATDPASQEIVTADGNLVIYLNRLSFSFAQLNQVSLIDRDNNFTFHYNTSEPFSKPEYTKQLEEHQEYIYSQQEKSGSSHINPTSYYVKNSNNEQVTLVVYRTFSPYYLISDSTFSENMELLTAVAEAHIDIEDDYIKEIIASFNNELTFSITPLPLSKSLTRKSNETLSNKYESGLTLQTSNGLINLKTNLSASYLDSQLSPFAKRIAGLVVIISFICFAILKLLIQKQIIHPIATLTRSVKSSKSNNFNLKTLDGVDEVAQLNNSYVELLDELNQIAKIDSLTGLSNRFLFNSSLRKMIGYSFRSGTKMALFYIDLDNFKQVNDNFGHGTGDRVLKTFSKDLTSIFEDTTLYGFENSQYDVARLAGDEFTVLLSDVKNDDAIALIAKKITSLCANGIQVDEKCFDIHVSIGIAISPDDSTNPDKLITCADSAMYQVKKTGKNGYKFYSSKRDEEICKHSLIEDELKQALSQDAFYLMWMPIFDCQTGNVTGAEALLRSNLPSLDQYGPAEFIPVAEATGLIKDIDYWVIESAVRNLQSLIKEYGFTGVLSVNFSAWEFKNQSFAQDISALLQKYQVPAAQLELEITETCLVSDNQQFIPILAQIRELGIRLSLDDFGTGYTAFNQLVNYPVDILKIDRTFVNAIESYNHEGPRPLVDIIAELASSYCLEVVAEGVETKEQLEYIRNLGCDRAQGYYLRKPISWNEFINLIHSDQGEGLVSHTIEQ